MIEEQANLGRHQILVVDDHEETLMAVQDALEKTGYAVLTATKGAEALQVMAETHPDLIISDIMMPEMDGYALYKAVRARPEWTTIPFIFLTVKVDKENVLKGKALGAEDYLPKPFDPHELVVAVGARLERAQAIQKATEARFDQLKNQIVTVLSHELSTPLTYIQFYIDLALREGTTHSSSDLQACLEGVKNGADRLTGLVKDLLAVIKLDTGRVAEQFRTLMRAYHDLDAIVVHTVEHYIEKATDRSVAIETSLEPDLPPVYLCKPLFEDALSRLLDNGVKFSQGEKEQVMVRAQTTGRWVEVSVTDHGVGIAAKELPNLFERFRQIDRDRMEQQGLGLGLAIAREYVQLHGGDISVESTPGQGSTFTIRLPVAEEV